MIFYVEGQGVDTRLEKNGSKFERDFFCKNFCDIHKETCGYHLLIFVPYSLLYFHKWLITKRVI